MKVKKGVITLKVGETYKTKWFLMSELVEKKIIKWLSSNSKVIIDDVMP